MKTRTWYLCSLLLFLAAVLFWRLGDDRQAAKSSRFAAEIEKANAARAAKAASKFTSLLTVPKVAPDGIGLPPVNASSAMAGDPPSSRYPNRLSNTADPIERLARSEKALLLRNAFIDTGKPVNLPIPQQLRVVGDPGSYLVQARGPLTDAFRAKLKTAGATIVSYIPNNAYLVTVSPEGARQLSTFAQKVLPWEPYYKLDDQLLDIAINSRPLPVGGLLRLTLAPGQRDVAAQAVSDLGAQIVSENDSYFGPEFVVQPPMKEGSLAALARLNVVQGIERVYERKPMNDLQRIRLSVAKDSAASTPNHLGLTGAGIWLSQTDTGVDTNHVGLFNRAFTDSTNTAYDLNGHGTRVAGIMIGSGAGGPPGTKAKGSAANANFRGKAPGAQLFGLPLFTIYSDARLQQIAALTNYVTLGRTNTLIANQSWDYGVAEYNSASASYDVAVRDALPGMSGSQPILFVFAAGNYGGGNAQGQGGYADSVLAPGNAKNVITVGAMDSLRYMSNNVTSLVVTTNGLGGFITNTVVSQPWLGWTDSANQVSPYSSRGNVAIGREGEFGRFKPDVIAPGSFVVSTLSSMFDATSYYNATNGYIVNLFTNLVIQAGQTNRFSINIPDSAYQFSINVLSNSLSPVPMTGLQIYTNKSPAFPPSQNAGNLAGTNSVTIAVSSATGSTGDWYYDLVNTNGSAVNFDIRTVIFYNTVQGGDYFQVLSNLNNTLDPSAKYNYESGTSMAAPAISGMLALMEEFFETTLGRTNSPALLKALLINGARTADTIYDLSVTNNITYQGWGVANLTNSLPKLLSTLPEAQWPVRFFDQNPTNTLATGQTHTRNLSLSAFARTYPLRVTLVWTDPPGNPAASIKLVNDLDLVITNLDTGEVFFGNNIPASSDFTLGSLSSASVTNDIVNNVENIYLSPAGVAGGLSANYSISVIGRSVNVNAVTENTNNTDNVVQDYALVISSGNTTLTQPFTTLTDPLVRTNDPTPRVTFLTSSTNGSPMMNQTVGANSSLLVSTNGMTNQWRFYVLTNNGPLQYVAFATFLPPNKSRSRNGNNADIDLFVSQNSDLTNLTAAAVSTAYKSVRRGGNESVVITNANSLSPIWYVGVKSEDQQAADFGFFAVASRTAFSSTDANGNQTLTGILFPNAAIPDGTPDAPGSVTVVAIAIEPITVRRVVVTDLTYTHENMGDLIGNLSHDDGNGERFVVLNNHRPEAVSTVTYVFDDSGEGDYVGVAQGTDGPGSLRDFNGVEGSGVWMLDVVDNALNHVGTVDSLSIRLDAQNAQNTTGGGGGTSLTNAPMAFRYDSIDVPVGATSLTINIGGINPPATGNLELYVRYGALPTRVVGGYDYSLVPVPALGGSITIDTTSTPPLTPGRYFIAVYNPNVSQVYYSLTYSLAYRLGVIPDITYTGNTPITLPDDAVTNVYSSLISSTQQVIGVQVGIRIDSPRASDYSIHVISPSGRRVLLTENRGGLSTNGYGTNAAPGPYIYTTFSENTNLTTMPIKFATPPFLGANGTNFATMRLVSTNFYGGAGNQRGTGIAITTNGVHLTGIDVTGGFSNEGLVLNYTYPVNNFAAPAWNISWPGVAGDDNFNGIGVSSEGVYIAADSLNRPSASAFNRGLAVKFPLTGATGAGFGGSAWDTLAHDTVAFPGALATSLNASTVQDEAGTLYNYVTGHGFVDGVNDAYYVSKLDTSGVVQWTVVDPLAGNFFFNNSSGRAITTLNGNIFIAGYLQFFGLDFGFVRKYDPTGALQASQFRFGGQFNGITAYNGELYVVGVDTSGISSDALVVKYDETLAGVNFTAYTSNERVLDFNGATDVFYGVVGIASGANGRIYAVGSTDDTTGGDLDMLIVDFDPVTGAAETPSTRFGGTGDDTARGVATDGADLYVIGETTSFGGGGNDVALLRYAVSVINSAVLPEESLSRFAGERAGGVWQLEIWDNRIGPTNGVGQLLSWNLELFLAATNAPVVPLAPGTVFNGKVAPGTIQSFSMSVPPWLLFTTNAMTSPSLGHLQLLYNETAPPTGSQVGDFTLLQSTSNGVAVVSNVRGNPILPAGRRYYLGVRNLDAVTNDFSLLVNYDTLQTTTLGWDYFLPAAIASGSARTNWYQFTVAPSDPYNVFEFQKLTGNVELLLRHQALPDGTHYDIRAVVTGTNAAKILIQTNNALPFIGGKWYAAVRSLQSGNVSYIVRAGPPLGNIYPELPAISNKTVNEGSLLAFTVQGTDSDVPRQTLTFSLAPGAPAGASIDPVTGDFTWTPTEAQGPGVYYLTVRVTDSGVPRRTTQQTFSVTVNEVNTAPVLATIPHQTVSAGGTLTVKVTATDADLPPNRLTYSVVTAPTGATIDASNGVFTWSPPVNTTLGDYSVTVRVTDNGTPSLSDSKSFTVTVNRVNTAPTMSPISPRTVNEGSLLTLTVSGSDTDVPAQTLTYSLVSGPSGATLNPITGSFAWTPTEAQGGANYTVTVRVTDNGSPNLSVTQSFTVTVNKVNSPPVLTVPGTQTLDELTQLSVTLTATDSDLPAQPVTFSLVSGPGGVSLNATTGVLTWTPSETQGPSTNTITVRATDNGSPAASVTNSFTVIVNEVNVTPVLSPLANRTISEGATLTFTATATDADRPVNLLTYSLDPGSPAGATIHPTAGVFTWTPTEAQGPSTNTITVRVTDNGKPPLSATRSFTVTVLEINSPPVLAPIADVTVPQWSTITFTNAATDPDLPANLLHFTLGAGAPAGASVNPTTGVFNWVLGDADTASTNLIRVIVTDDGVPSLSVTQSFTVTITAIPTNIVDLVNGVAVNGTAIPSSRIFTFYRFNVPVGSPRALFEMFNLTGNGDLVARRGAFPTLTQFDFNSANPGNQSEQIVVKTNASLTDISGDWYLAVVNTTTNNIDYAIGASVPKVVVGGSLLVSSNPLKVSGGAPVITEQSTPQINWSAVVGEKYQVDVSTDLKSWTVLTSVVVGSPNATFTDPTPYTSSVQRFYRIRQVPQ